MGSSSSKESTAADKVATKADKVLKSVNGDIKSAASDVKKGVDKAVVKTNSAVKKTGKEVTKAVDDLLGDSKKDDDRHLLKDTVVAVPVVALVVVAGVWLWKNKPWEKKSDGAPKAA